VVERKRKEMEKIRKGKNVLRIVKWIRKENDIVFCNDPRKSASHICAITPKGLVDLKLSLESLIKPSFT
jgi:hypothetical protein